MSNPVTWEAYHQVVCAHLGMGAADITPQTDIYKDLGLDSLGVVSLGIKLHSIFKVKVPMSAVSEIYTVEDMFNVLNRYLPK